MHGLVCSDTYKLHGPAITELVASYMEQNNWVF